MMGGNIHVAFRDTDGTLMHMERWTNPLPTFVKDVMVDDPEDATRDWMSSYYQMKSDWEENKETGNFQLPMTSVYFPQPEDFQVSEYGMIYLDLQNKILISNNKYSSMNTCMGVELKVHPEDTVQTLKQAVKQDALYHLPDGSPKDAGLQKVSSVEELRKIVYEIFWPKGGDRMTDLFTIHPAGWYVDDYWDKEDFDIKEFKRRVDQALKAQRAE